MRKYTKEHLQNFTIEELGSFKDDDLELFSIDILKSILRMKKSEEEEDKRNEKFWKWEYPNLPIDDKAKYWASGLFRSMRMQEESGQNPYAIYSENWLRDALNTDSNFVELLPKIYNVWGGMFDAGKVDRIVKRHFKKIDNG